MASLAPTMRIVTNPGSNLDEDFAHAKDVDLLPQKIVVDGISHDTRNTIDFSQVDAWVKKAAKHPVVQGTTEQECLDLFSRLAKKDKELLVVMSSRKIIGSHDAAVAAGKQLMRSSDPALAGVKVEVVDSYLTDAGAGLVTLAAVQARRAGLSLQATAEFARTFARRNVNTMALATLENLIKGGRASFLQAWVANFLNIRPLISFVDGALESVGRMSSKADMADKLDEHFSSRIDPKTAVWLAISHGNAPDKAQHVARRLQERYRCEFTLMRPLSTSIYLHAGPGSVLAMMLPLDGLPFRPTPP